MNLSPGGLDDGPPGFPYFAGDGKFEFGYGGPPFHPHDSPFFPGHPGGPMPFNAPGKYFKKLLIIIYSYLILGLFLLSGGPMDHSGPIPMVGDFGMTPESSFMGQQSGPPGNGPEHMLGGPRGGGSPEFMTSGNFSEPQNMQNEGLVW